MPNVRQEGIGEGSMAVLLLLITLRLLTPLALAPPLLAPRTTVPAMIDSAEWSLNE